MDSDSVADGLNEPSAVLSNESRQRRAESRKRRDSHFIKGPLPLIWFEQAANLPGKALAVALLLWFKRGMNGPDGIRVTRSLLNRFGVGRKAGNEALKNLSAIGLIRADIARGRVSRVDILSLEIASPNSRPVE